MFLLLPFLSWELMRVCYPFSLSDIYLTYAPMLTVHCGCLALKSIEPVEHGMALICLQKKKKKAWRWCSQHFSDSRSDLDMPVWLMTELRRSSHSELSSCERQETKSRQFWCLFWNWYQCWISKDAKPVSEVALTGQIKKYLIATICMLKKNSSTLWPLNPKREESHNTSFYHAFTVHLRLSFWRTNQQRKEKTCRL